MDCECCGDRWNPTDESYGTERPSMYGRLHNEKGEEFQNFNLPVFIFYKDGRKEKFKE